MDRHCSRGSGRAVIGWMIRRLLATIPVLLGVTLVSFVLTYLLPGDPARAMAGERYREEDLVP